MNTYITKLCIVGNACVGKTNLLNAFCNEKCNVNQQTTIGIEFLMKDIYINNKLIKTQLWDTGGQERYSCLVEIFYRQADGIILTFDLTSESSLNDIIALYKKIKNDNYYHKKFILAGTKSDIKKNNDVSSLASKFASENNMSFYETSAFLNSNVKEIFMSLINDIISEYIKEENKETNTPEFKEKFNNLYCNPKIRNDSCCLMM